jgi:hypothetical protein
VLGFHFRVGNGGSGDGNMLLLQNNGYIRIWYDTANARVVFSYRYTSVSETFIATDAGSVDLNVWHYLEVDFEANKGSQGYVYLWLDGELHASTGPVDFYQDCNIILFGGTSSDTCDVIDFDDIYLTDFSGEPPYGRLGPVDLFEIYPDGNGNSSQLVGQDANSTDNYLNVDESPPDDGTTYNGSGTDGDKDTYSFDNLSGTPDLIPAMMVKMHAAKTDSGTKFLKPVVRTAESLSDYTTTPTISASSTFTTYVAGNAWRVAASYWVSGAVGATEWWKADFGSAKGFGQVDIDITAGGSTYPTVMVVQYSDDDSDWEDAGPELTGVTAGSHTLYVTEGGTHRYWRILFSSFSGSSGMEADNIYFYEVVATAQDNAGDSSALAETYGLHQQGYGRNPGTNNLLTYTDINAMEFGAQVSDT